VRSGTSVSASTERSTAEVTVTRAGAIVPIGAAKVGQGVETILWQIPAGTLGIALRSVRTSQRGTGW
jgi:CO/xanthine dehydrogenase Mo-binding subunit